MANLKKLTALAIILIALFSSCTTKEYYEVYPESFTKDYTVRKADWKIGEDDESGAYLYYEFKEPDLTQEIYNHGAMQAFLKMNDGNLTPLPFNDYWKDGDLVWTEQATVEFRPGYITFILKYSDHVVDVDPYCDYSFRVRFVW